jgi:hypothetical protein
MPTAGHRLRYAETKFFMLSTAAYVKGSLRSDKPDILLKTICVGLGFRFTHSIWNPKTDWNASYMHINDMTAIFVFGGEQKNEPNQLLRM